MRLMVLTNCRRSVSLNASGGSCRHHVSEQVSALHGHWPRHLDFGSLRVLGGQARRRLLVFVDNTAGP